MRSLISLVGLVLIMLVVAVPTGAQEAPPSSEPAYAVDCADPEYLSNALVSPCDICRFLSTRATSALP